ncbi:RUN domain-containing protein, partial [Reticulomyxa filosa]
NNNNNNNNSLNDNNTRKSSIQSKDKKKQADDEDDDEKQKEHDNFMEKEFQASQIRRVVSFSLTKSKNQKKKFFKKKSRMIEKRNVIRDRDVTGDKWSKEDFDDVSKEMEEELNRLVKKVYNFFFVTKKKKESSKGSEIAALLTPHNNGIMDSQALDNEDNRTVIENFNSLLDGQAFGDTTNRVDSPIVRRRSTGLFLFIYLFVYLVCCFGLVGSKVNTNQKNKKIEKSGSDTNPKPLNGVDTFATNKNPAVRPLGSMVSTAPLYDMNVVAGAARKDSANNQGALASGVAPVRPVELAHPLRGSLGTGRGSDGVAPDYIVPSTAPGRMNVDHRSDIQNNITTPYALDISQIANPVHPLTDKPLSTTNSSDKNACLKILEWYIAPFTQAESIQFSL